MTVQPDFTDPETWVANLFVSQVAREGAVIRRKCRDVGRDVFLDDMHRRGFSVVENAGQFVIFCNREPIPRVCCPNSEQNSSRTHQWVRNGIYLNSALVVCAVITILAEIW